MLSKGGMIWIILLCVYIYLGDKANQFCKKNILHLETIIVYDISEWITNRAIWGLLIGCRTIPVAVLIWLFGVHR